MSGLGRHQTPAVRGTNFGLAAATALERGEIEGFWANGVAAELAVVGGFGTVVLEHRHVVGSHCFRFVADGMAVRYPGITSRSLVRGAVFPEEGWLDLVVCAHAMLSAARRRHGAKVICGARIVDLIMAGDLVSGVRLPAGRFFN